MSEEQNILTLKEIKDKRKTNKRMARLPRRIPTRMELKLVVEYFRKNIGFKEVAQGLGYESANSGQVYTRMVAVLNYFWNKL